MSPFRVLYVGSTDPPATLTNETITHSFDRTILVTSYNDFAGQHDGSMIDCIVVEPPIDTATLESVSTLYTRNPTISVLILSDKDTAAELTKLLSTGAVYVPTAKGKKNEHLRQELQKAINRTNSKRRSHPWQQSMEGLSQLFAYPTEAELSASDILRRAVAIGQSTLGYEIGYGTQVIDDSYTVEAVAGTHDELQTGMEGKLADTYCKKTVETLKPVSVTDAADGTFAESPMYRELGLRSYVGAPVLADGSVYGTLCFADSEPKESGMMAVDTMVVDILARWASSEIERLQYERELTRQAERIEEFAEVVSSDLRNQLNVIQGRNAILDDMYNDRQSELIADAATKIESIVDDSLEWVQKGKPIKKIVKVDVQTLIDELWYLVSDKDIYLRAVDTFVIRADWSRLMELFENLIQNMIANNDQEITIRVGEITEMYTATRAPTTDASGFYVETDGHGIPDVDHEKVFQPADVTRIDETGFKLSIVKQIAEAHGWKVTLTESVDGGVRFEFTDIV